MFGKANSRVAHDDDGGIVLPINGRIGQTREGGIAVAGVVGVNVPIGLVGHHDAVHVCAGNQRLVLVNPKAQALIGYGKHVYGHLNLDRGSRAQGAGCVQQFLIGGSVVSAVHHDAVGEANHGGRRGNAIVASSKSAVQVVCQAHV